LTLTGDSVDVGDHKDAKPVFDLDSVQLLNMIKNLEGGADMAGNALKGAPQFYPGSTVHPEADFIEAQLLKFDKKVNAGACFFQTQGIFNLGSLRRFMQYASQFNVKILAGIIVLSSGRMAKYMNEFVPGIIIDQDIIDELSAVEKGKGLQKGIEIAARMIRTIKDEQICHGVHIMAVGNEKIVPDIIEAADITGVRA
jgi:5,10-methylenetetrahydrofolate reductase